MGSGQSVINTETHIVVIGAGYGGTTLASGLLKMKANFTLISPGDSFHHNVGSVRAVCVKGWGSKILIPLEKTYGDHFKKDKVTEIRVNEKEVLLASGETVKYDILVIATGTVDHWPIKVVEPQRDDCCTKYNEVVEKVKAANKITVIGGGPTGVEMAAEFAVEYPDKEITLVHSSDKLLNPNLSEKGQNYLKQMLKNEFKLKLVLGERVENLSEISENEPTTVKTDKGTEIPADIVFKCTGLRVHTEAYENGLGHVMDEKTRALKVNECLQVEGYDNIFALGDCNNIAETKLAYHASQQAETLIKTLYAHFSGKKPVVYKPDPSPMAAFISLGPNKAFVETKGGWGIPNIIGVNLKSKDLMAGKKWKEMEQKFPQ